MKYNPSLVPNTIESTWLQAELRKIAEAMEFGGDSLRMATSYAAPGKFVEGEIRIADGIVWDPGRGAGTYVYRNGSWKLVEAGFHSDTQSKAFFLSD